MTSVNSQWNLLPWRKNARDGKNKQQKNYWLKCALLGIVILLFARLCFSFAMMAEKGYQYYWWHQWQRFQQKASVVLQIHTQQKTLTAQQQFVTQLMAQRQTITPLLQVITQSLPDGVYLTSLSRQGTTLVMLGKSETTDQITALLNNLTKQTLWTNPAIVNQKADNTQPPYQQVFTVQMQLKSNKKTGGTHE